jgi:hypothetical protein
VGPSQITDGGAFNSALTDLNSNAGALSLEGDTLAVTGDLANTGRIDIDDQFGGAGGSTLSVGGTLINSNVLDIGETNLGSADLVTAAALANTGVIDISGDATAGATLRIVGVAGFGTAGTISGTANLNDGTISFASGSITTILNGAQLQMVGTSQVTDAGGAFNSVLAHLAANAGELSIEGDRLAISGDFANSGRVDVDDQFGGAGGSTLAVGGTLTNSGQLVIGETNLGSAVLVTAAALVNTGLISVDGDSTAGATLRVAGAAGFGTAGTVGGSVDLSDGTIFNLPGQAVYVFVGSHDSYASDGHSGAKQVAS